MEDVHSLFLPLPPAPACCMASTTPSLQQWTADTTTGHDSLIDSASTPNDGTLHDRKDAKAEVELKPLEIQAQVPTSKKTPYKRWTALFFYCILAIVISAPFVKMSINIYEEGADEPNPPVLPKSIVVFHPPRNENEIKHMQRVLDTYSDPILNWEEFSNKSSAELPNHPGFTHTSANHFTSKRTALLFTPGVYPVDVQIGYYTSLYGLGSHPDNVTFMGAKGPHCPALDKFTDRPPNGSGLNSFWRSVENVATKPQNGMTWAVSQAAPLRRIHVHGDLNLFDSDSWVSGGFGGNIQVEGSCNFGGQQQWMMRNAHIKSVSGGAWSLVFVGCTGGIPNETMNLDEAGPLISVETEPKVMLEKPYIALKHQYNQTGFELELRIPKIRNGKDTTGINLHNDEEVRDFRTVKLAIPSTNPDANKAAVENHSKIQMALDNGKDIVLSPGIYNLSSSLEIKHPNQVILGLGYATLTAPTNGSPCIHVQSKVPGVKIAGVMLEASVLTVEGQAKRSCLLEWGEDGVVDNGDETNPGLLSGKYIHGQSISVFEQSTKT